MIDNKVKYTNSLIHEQSPYLLQHAHNPVDWRAWNDETFAIAEREDKPIFLSIGYATCHWCHVMERESFEDVEVAELLNANFISVKLDREERPDIDSVYMEVCQAMVGHGGWPLTILMMPDKKPFFAGTYFPKRSSLGRAGILDILDKINSLWKTNREKIVESSTYIFTALQAKSEQDFYSELPQDILEKTVDSFTTNFDRVNGGFRQSPKFPSPHQLCFLLRMYRKTGESSTLQMVVKTLKSMANGGIWDHIGYGFHRYSTDEKWLLPHFEKMLYDQAWLTIAFTEAYQLTKDEEFRTTAENILAYVKAKLTSESGAFFSAEDADSEGVEGKFYVWNVDEITEILGEKDALLFNEIYSIERYGNFQDEASGEQTRDNIPHLSTSLENCALMHKIDSELLKEKLEKIRIKLWEKREVRVHPLLDDKILADWNGMMIAAFAKAGAAFQNPNFTESAERAWKYIQSTMIDSNGGLLHRSRNNKSAIPAFLDDYSALAFGLFELYQTTGKYEYIEECTRLTEETVKLFEAENGGFLQTKKGNDATPFSGQKQVYDGAIPSGNSMMIDTLFRLGTLLQRNDFLSCGMKAIYSFGKQIEQYPTGFAWMLSALEFFTGSRQEIVIKGEIDNAFILSATKRLLQEFMPGSVIMYSDGVSQTPIQTEQYDLKGGNAAVLVCENYHCNLPMTTVEQLDEFISSESTVRGTHI